MSKTYTQMQADLSTLFDRVMGGQLSPDAAVAADRVAGTLLHNEKLNLQFAKQRGEKPAPGYFPIPGAEQPTPEAQASVQ